VAHPGPRLLARGDLEALLDVDACRAAVEEAFRQHGAGEAPPPGVLGLATESGGFHVKAGVLRLNGRAYFAAKVNGNFAGNAARGLPRIQGVVVLADGETGTPLALLDSGAITELRTAAATAVAARFLARPDSATATIVGCGVQGRAHLRSLARVLPLRRAFAFDVDAAQAQAFARVFAAEEEGRRETGGEIPLKGNAWPPLSGLEVLAADDLREALAESDVVAACTPSQQPYLFGRDTKPGTFVAAVGADAEDKQEIDPSLLASAKVVTDITAQCAAFGDLHHAIEAGALSASDVHAELGEVVAGRRPGRTSDAEVVVFDSTGMALQDVAAAAAAFEAAERTGRGLSALLSG
jgi:ornithine cyclodeaminase/alanine dehydrogenase-like protein (mu-crystallin family)